METHTIQTVSQNNAAAAGALTEAVPATSGSSASASTLDHWVSLLGGMQGIIDSGIWFVAGFGVGYLIKRYTKLLCSGMAGAVLIGLACWYLGIITVHRDVLYSLCGIQKTAGQTSPHLAEICHMLKAHAFIWGAGLVGFLMGHIAGGSRATN